MKRIFFTVSVILAVALGSTLPVFAYNVAAPTAVAVTAVKPALAMKAPASAQVGEAVIITVYETKSNTPVSGAKVWALSANSMAATTASTNDVSSYAVKYGIFLGETDKQGQVMTKFEKAGQYILVAVKDSYIPGVSKISIGDVKTLVIRAPSTVKVWAPFSLRVVEQSVLTVEIPVPKADVWAVDSAAIAVLNVNTDLTTAAQKRGIHLGYTDEKGYVQPEPVFNRAGIYWLIALKDGYTPAITKIVVNGPVTATPTTKPPITKPLTTKPNSVIGPAASVTNSIKAPTTTGIVANK
jgi:hypothetical protein